MIKVGSLVKGTNVGSARFMKINGAYGLIVEIAEYPPKQNLANYLALFNEFVIPVWPDEIEEVPT